MVFCTRCFASEKDASWGGEVIKDYCFNCGCGCIIDIEEYHIKNIRQSASWVGKRYYPDKEDIETNKELKYARSNLPIPANRAAKRTDEDNFWVSQPTETGTISVVVEAESESEALEKSRVRLPLI
jgi:hypothetical protein